MRVGSTCHVPRRRQEHLQLARLLGLGRQPQGPTIEIDIAEIWDGVLQTNYHPEGGSKSHSYSGYYGSAFHTWTMYRTPKTDYFYIDGTLLYTMPVDSTDTGLPQYMLFNNGVQGNHQQIPATMFIDYVRAWAPKVGGGTVINPHGGFSWLTRATA